ncbi:MAG: hypothetical protein JW810_03780 [Sedimentisphaerales bacterium]|nr:hypothetical protein [Sedimentisphaerales bacterium]
MAKTKTENAVSIWTFRREVTLGTLVHLGTLVVVLIAAWANLRAELTLIRHELGRLNQTQQTLQANVEHVAGQNREHEYRLKELERKTAAGEQAYSFNKTFEDLSAGRE